MAKIKPITTHKKYRALVAMYRYNWVAACLYLFGAKATLHQILLLGEAQKKGARVTVSSGHGTGKSYMISIVVIMYMLFFPDARVVLVANKIDQVKIGVMKNLKANWRLLEKRHPWIARFFVLTDEQFYERAAKGIWFVSSKSCRQGNEEALAGEHAKHLLWIVDEASGVSDKAFGVMTGSLTEADNRMILLSQPTRSGGFFWDTHNDPAIKKNWVQLIFNSEDSKIVTEDFILEKFRQYGGSRDAIEYMIKVRGMFPESLEGFLLSRSECERATLAKPKLADDWGWVALCDVGNGRDSSVLLIGKVSGDRFTRRFIPAEIIEKPGNMDPVNFGRLIVDKCKDPKYPNITVAIDADGVGSSTCVIAEEGGLNVQRIRWGFPMFTKDDKSRFINKRAFAHIMVRDAVKEGRMKLDPHNDTIAQGAKLPIKLNERGQNAIMPKEQMREKEGIKSPDRFDCYCFSMLVSYTPANMLITEDMKNERESVSGWAA